MTDHAVIVVGGERYRVLVYSTTCEVSRWCDCLLGPHWHLIDAPRLRSLAAVERWLRGMAGIAGIMLPESRFDSAACHYGPAGPDEESAR
jgi:hypothetical protein